MTNLYVIPSKDVATYPDQARIYDVDIDIIRSASAGIGVVSGCDVTPQGSPDMTVAVASGVIITANGTLAVTGANKTISTADATNPRIDLLTASSSAVLTVTSGTAATNPKPPSLPSGHVALAYIYVPANITSINASRITQKGFPVSGSDLAAELDGTPVVSGVSEIRFVTSGTPTAIPAALITAYSMFK